MKKVTTFKKVWACILVLTLLVGVLGPMQAVQAEVNYADSGSISLCSESTGQYSQTTVIFFQTTDTSIASGPEMQLVEGSGSLTMKKVSEVSERNLYALGSRFYSKGNGKYQLYLLDTNEAEVGDTVTLEGKFATADGSAGVNYQKITFEYVFPTGAAKGYWAVCKEISYVDSGAITLHGNSTGMWSQNTYIYFNTEAEDWSLTERVQLFSKGGTITKGSEDIASTNTQLFRAKTGEFYIYLYGGKEASSGDKYTLEGKFATADGTYGINFSKTVFKCVADASANNGIHWEIIPETTYVDSGEITLQGNSTGIWSQKEYVWFNTEVESWGNTSGVQIIPVEGSGSIIKKNVSTGNEEEIAVSNTQVFRDPSGAFYIYLYGGKEASSGDKYTLEGKFATADGTHGINFSKTIFKCVADASANNGIHWEIVPEIIYVDSGAVTLHNNSVQYTQNNHIFFNTEVEDWSLSARVQLFSEGGKISKVNTETGVAEDITAANTQFFRATSGEFYIYLYGGKEASNGDVYTLEGKFSTSDGTKGVDFQEVTFTYVDGAKKYWEIVKQIDYIDSGALSLHSNSSSPRSTSGSYDGNKILWFNTSDVTFPKHNGTSLIVKGGQITVKKAGTNEVVDVYANGASVFSQSEGLYALYLLDANAVSNGDLLTIQGKFAMSDGSAGINFQPVTYKYIEANNQGYWIAEGKTFTSGQYLKTEKSYTSEILAFEADIRLSANATNKGGVILGTDDGSSDAYTFGVDANGAPYLSVKDGSNEAVEYKFTGVDVCTNEWVNLVIKRDKTNGKVTCFVDGTSKGELSITDNSEILPTADAVVGGNDSQDNAQFFKGRIRAVKLYADTNKTSLIADYDMSYIGANAKTVSDGSGNAYDLSYSFRWMDKAPSMGDYAYSFAVVGDTQTLNDSYTTEMEKVYKYITDNATRKNTKFVFGLGDITEWNGTRDINEWQRAQDYITTLDDAGIPYSLCRGNHDGVLTSEGSTRMNEYFPYENYKDKLSVYYDGKIENSCQFLTVGNVDYMIFALDYNPSEDVLEWAGSIIETHPHHNVIITTHSYISVNKQYTAESNGNGSLIWEKLVKKYSNIVLVLCGHVGANDIVWNQVEGDNGNLVTQMVVNPQYIDAGTDGGAGMVAMLYFSEDGKNVQVEYYSTIRNQWLADTNQFSFELNVVEHVEAITVKPYTNVLTTYRSTEVYTYPEIDGYVFAGWFTNEACTKEYALAKDASVDDTITYYAKFVDKNAITLKRQITEGTTLSSETTNLRLVTTLDSLDYSGYGFLVTIGGITKNLGLYTTGYRSLSASKVTYQPKIISAASQYFATVTINGFTATSISNNISIGVQPYWVTIDGTTVLGVLDTKTLVPTE